MQSLNLHLRRNRSKPTGPVVGVGMMPVTVTTLPDQRYCTVHLQLLRQLQSTVGSGNVPIGAHPALA